MMQNTKEGILDPREAMLAAKALFLKINDSDEEIARQAAFDFRSLMDEWGITLENMYRWATLFQIYRNCFPPWSGTERG